MSESKIRSGGCSCGAVRYETEGDPVRVMTCHCKQCQRRTGSAFGIGCYFPKQKVNILQGDLKTFERSSDAGRWFKSQFCTECGSTVLWHLEIQPDAVAIAGGSFDDIDWIEPQLHFWSVKAHNWIQIPKDVKVFQEQP